MTENTISQVQYIDANKLEVWEDNPRLIQDDNFKWLCESLKEDSQFFENRPCLVNQLNGKLIIYAGAQRYKAAQKLGWKEIPCIVNQISEDLMKERALKDNDHAGEYDYNKLESFDVALLKKVNLKNIQLKKTELNAIKESFSIPQVFFNDQKLEDDILEDDDSEEEPSPLYVRKVEPEKTKPSRNTEQYAMFEIFMLSSSKERIISVLNHIREKYGYEKLEDALLKLCDFYND